MAIKLVALDLDDTLLNSKLAVSPRACEAIRQAVAQGVTVTIATGRMYRSALPYARQLGLDVPIITYNGALIKSCLSGEVLLDQPIERKLSQQVLALCKERGWYIQNYVRDELYVEKINQYAEQYSRLAAVPVTAVGDRLYDGEESSNKMLIMSTPEGIVEIYDICKALFGNQLSIAISKPTYLEITDPLANKGRALAFLADKLGIKKEETMAVGDSGNDVDMLKYAGWSVAMGNASAAVKAIARLETLANDADGVAEAIEKYVLA
ncbi:Cof-type HAD-IIB family hydrolase [Sporomusa sphaeroides]|uniref:Cof-type HAD-IIB family hydrolase n=1 Tax=Sporomusa sphaeroides TaxID=47679 RepID=UPI002BA0DDD5|nr:Cof-type HAD-IIB family hydrolase [Sporomusa sphaeroides]HML32360.1 Cof-type HAD-IIB family hydrolase [Sporomusa sphaeroides]